MKYFSVLYSFTNSHCHCETLTLCRLRSLRGSKQSTEQLCNVTANIVVGAVHRSETQRRNVVELGRVQERRLIHQLTQTLHQHIDTLVGRRMMKIILINHRAVVD